MKQFDISGGISLNYIEDKKFKTTTLLVAIHTPLCRNSASKNALLPLVLKRGSKNYKTFDEMERKLSSLCGAELLCNVIKRGEDQVLCFEMSVISDKYSIDEKDILKQSSNLLLDVIFNPLIKDGGFLKEYVESEKTNLCDMIDAGINDKQNYALWRLYENMCAGENFGIHELGVKEDILNIDEKDLYEHYKTVVETAPIDIFVCGEADISDFELSLKDALKEVVRNPKKYPKTVPHEKRDEVLNACDEFDANQAKLSLGFSTGIGFKSDMYYSLIVANSIFGSGVHSKLFNNVREKLSLAYYAFSRLERRKQIMLVGMGIEEKNYQKALDETLLQKELLQKGEVSDEEFNSAIMFLTNNARSVKDSQLSLIMFYLDNKIDGVCITPDDYCEKIKSVTKESAIEAFKNVCLDTIYLLKGKTKDGKEE